MGPMTYPEMWMEHLSRLTHEEQMADMADFLNKHVRHARKRGRLYQRVDRTTLERAAALLAAAARRLEETE